MAQIVTPFTHEEMRNWLSDRQGASIVNEICRLGGHESERQKFAFDQPRYRSFGEITLIDKEWHEGEYDKYGRMKYRHYRMDAVLSILPARDSMNQNDCPVAGIELKGSESDLMGESELVQYMLWFDYTFIGVPTALLDAAEKKLELEGLTGIVGILDVQEGKVVAMAEHHSVDPVRALRVLQRIQINYLFGDTGGNVITVMQEVDTKENGEKREDGRSGDSDGDNAAPVTVIDASEAAARAARRKQRMQEIAAAGEMLPDEIRTRLTTLSPKAQQAYHFLSAHPGARSEGIEEELGVSEPASRRYLAELVTSGLAEHRGSKKTGGYFPTHDAAQVANMQKCRSCIVLRKLGFRFSDLDPSDESNVKEVTGKAGQ